MGKPSKKATPSKNVAGQQKISSFFQGKPPEKKKQLFSTVGDAKSSSNDQGKLSFKKEHNESENDLMVIPETQPSYKSPGHSSYQQSHDKNSHHQGHILKEKICNEKSEVSADKDVVVIPETQSEVTAVRKSSTSENCSDIKHIKKSADTETPSKASAQQSSSDSDDAVIPDTPDCSLRDNACKKKVYQRSFLKPVSRLHGKNGLDGKSGAVKKQSSARKKTKMRLTNHQLFSPEPKLVGAAFNSLLCEEGIDMHSIVGNGTLIQEHNKSELLAFDHVKCGKRSSSKGESPDPKRTARRKSGSNTTRNSAKISLNWGEQTSDQSKNLSGKQVVTSQSISNIKNKKLNSKDDVKLDCDQDEALCDILSELKENEFSFSSKDDKTNIKTKASYEKVTVSENREMKSNVCLDLNRDDDLNDIITELRYQNVDTAQDGRVKKNVSNSEISGSHKATSTPKSIHCSNSVGDRLTGDSDLKSGMICKSNKTLSENLKEKTSFYVDVKGESHNRQTIASPGMVMASEKMTESRNEDTLLKKSSGHSSNSKHDSEKDVMISERPHHSSDHRHGDEADGFTVSNAVGGDANHGYKESMEILDDSILDDLALSQEFSQMSPFKSAQSSFSKELPPSRQFGRHIVTDVSHQQDHTIHLTLKSDDASNNAVKTCILQGFWCDTRIAAGDILHVIGEFDHTHTCVISDLSGQLVVNPDLLISGTSVVGGIHCMRRAVLNEKFKGSDSKNIHMLYGSIIHSFFQQVLLENSIDEGKVNSVARTTISRNKFLQDMYGHGVSEDIVMEEIQKYIPQLLQFVQKYVPSKQRLRGQFPSQNADKTIVKVIDIEENVWSPRYGVKGKIDLTVEIKNKKTGKHVLMPLELKTGRATYSVEHKGQVTLYSMMSCDRREDPEGGLLLYLREGDMKTIPAYSANKRGLLQLRNEQAYYLLHSVEKSDDDGTNKHRCAHLPQPINNPRTCGKCPQLLNCALYQRSVEEYVAPPGHAMQTLVPEAIGHLSVDHLKYFTKWCLMMHLEMKADNKKTQLKDIWCKTGTEREAAGEAISNLVLSKQKASTQSDGDYFLQTFIRRHACQSRKALSAVGLNKGMSIVVSAENRTLIALSYGSVYSVDETSVELLLDRNLQADPSHNDLVFRVDRCDIYNSMTSNFNNLSRLMLNDPVSDRLRRLIIDREKPTFNLTLSKGDIEKVKPVFKKLNKPQKTAILKALMSKGYVLIKGYPGTGKTSTIVSLVRILHLLGYSVLLTSYTHTAVDNILLKLKQHKLDFLRIGRRGRIHPDIYLNSAEYLTSHLNSVKQLEEFYSSKSIVATTCLGTNHVLFTKRSFDVCIVDEASQVLQLACLGPLFCSQKFVLVGDPKQLPPVVQSAEARELGMDESLFMRLDDMGASYELNLQYRMNSEIMSISNMLMYSGALQCGNQAVATQKFLLAEQASIQHLPGWIQSTLTAELSHAVQFLDTDRVPGLEKVESSGVIRNEVEASLVLKLIKTFIQCGTSPDDIGVISPYMQQVTYVKELLLKQGFEKVEVNTVDQYQGRDKNIIIVTFVRSNKEDGAVSRILNDDRRLNVAVTRARHKLLLLGSRLTLQHYPPIHKIISYLKPHQMISLPQHCHKEVNSI